VFCAFVFTSDIEAIEAQLDRSNYYRGKQVTLPSFFISRQLDFEGDSSSEARSRAERIGRGRASSAQDATGDAIQYGTVVGSVSDEYAGDEMSIIIVTALNGLLFEHAQ
jgi:hypothetical protein